MIEINLLRRQTIEWLQFYFFRKAYSSLVCSIKLSNWAGIWFRNAAFRESLYFKCRLRIPKVKSCLYGTWCNFSVCYQVNRIGCFRRKLNSAVFNVAELLLWDGSNSDLFSSDSKMSLCWMIQILTFSQTNPSTVIYHLLKFPPNSISLGLIQKFCATNLL